MKLESFKSEKFTKLKNSELNKINGGKAEITQDPVLPGTGVTLTWTLAEKRTDESCSDC